MQLGWIYFNRDDRNRVFAALKALEEQDAADELGVGKIRDYFSNILFPGITTNQKRAKYFVILPNLFEDAINGKFDKAKKRNSNKDLTIQSWFEDQQNEWVRKFCYNPKNKNETGIMGSRSFNSGKEIRQRPLPAYWSGLKKYQIVRDEGGEPLDESYRLDYFCQLLLDYIEQQKSVNQNKNACSGSKSDSDNDYFHNNLNRDNFFPKPKYYKENWDEKLEMRLNSKEAEFLFERITNTCPDSLLTLILKYYFYYYSNPENNNIIDSEDDLFSINDPLKSFLILRSGLWNSASAELKRTYRLANQFRSFYYGCQLMYSHLVSGEKDVLDNFKNWLKEMQEWPAINQSNESSFLNDIFTIDGTAKDFLSDARTIVIEKSSVNNKIDKFKKLITKREKELKQDRAKIGKDEKYKNANPLDYRASTARIIIMDILSGLKKIQVKNPTKQQD